MAGYADELSLKLTAKDEMSARLRGVQKELESVHKSMRKAEEDFKATGSPQAAAELDRLGNEFRRLAKAQDEAKRASKAARDELARMQKEAAKATTAMGRLGQSITKHATAIRNAGLIAGAAMLLFAKQSISVFADAEKQQTMLNQAYSRFTKINDVTRASFDALNTSIMNLTGTDDDALASAEALLARFDLTGKQIQEVIPLIADYAIATEQDLEGATKKVGMALLGNAKALKAMGINFKASGDRAADYSAIMAILEQKVGGVGEAFGKTTAGQLAIANENFENLKETVGASLVPALQMFVGVLTPIVGFLTALPQPLQQVGAGVTALGIAAMIATPRLIALNTALKLIGLTLGTVAAVATVVIAVLIGLAAATMQVNEAGQKFHEGQKTAAQTLNENAGILGFLSIGYGNLLSVIDNVTDAMSKDERAADAASKSLRQAAAGMKMTAADARDAGTAADGTADSLAKMTVFTNRARAASLGLARALGKVAAILDRDDAAKAYRKSVRDYIAKPSVDAAKDTVRAFLTVMGTFKDGSKAGSDFALKNLPAVESAIRTSGMSRQLRRQLLAPLEAARQEAIRVQQTIDLLHGKRIAITYTGGTPTNPGGYVKPYTGGLITGPGTGTSDSIPAMVSNGEYVIRAAAVKSIGVDTLRALNHADKTPVLPSLVNAPTITLPASSTGRDAPLVGVMNVHPTGQVDLELALAREARRQDRDRRTRYAGANR